MKWLSTPGIVYLVLLCLNDARIRVIHLVFTQSFPKNQHLVQSILEWTKYNLWNTVFKKFEAYGLLKHKLYLVRS